MKSDTVVELKGIRKTYNIWESPSSRIWVPIMRAIQSRINPNSRFYTTLAERLKKNCREFTALNNIDFNILKGESIGLLGRNGSGKSTLLQIIAGTLNPSSGSVNVSGKVAALLELGSGFDPEFTGIENVFMNGSILGLTKSEISSRIDEIAEFADIGEFIDQPVKTYSSGMMVRLAFSVSIATKPEILIIDEALSVGDAAFQRKCFRRIEEIRERGCTFIFVSHDLNAITNLTNRAILLERGKIRFEGDPLEAGNRYQQLIFGERQTSAAKNYGDGNAEICSMWLEDEQGNQLETINSSKAFIFCYEARFNVDIDNPIFGLRVTNVHGVLLVSSNTSLLNKKIGRIKTAQTVVSRWRFSLPLTPGYVFFSAGISYPDEDRFLARRLDSLKVAIQGSFDNVGLLASVSQEQVTISKI